MTALILSYNFYKYTKLRINQLYLDRNSIFHYSLECIILLYLYKSIKYKLLIFNNDLFYY